MKIRRLEIARRDNYEDKTKGKFHRQGFTRKDNYGDKTSFTERLPQLRGLRVTVLREKTTAVRW